MKSKQKRFFKWKTTSTKEDGVYSSSSYLLYKALFLMANEKDYDIK